MGGASCRGRIAIAILANPGAGNRNRSGWILASLACSVAAGPLLQGLRHGFYQDDFRWLEESYRCGGRLPEVLSIWRPGEVRPVAQFLYWVQAHLFGLRPLLFNLSGLALHLLAAALVFRFGRRAGGSGVGADAGAILFLAGWGHYGKPVAWSCSHSILLGTVFLLGALLWVYADPVPGAVRQSLRTAGALLLAALAAFTHELFCLAPAILAACIVHRGTPRRWIWSCLALAAGVVYIVFTWTAHRLHPVQAGTIWNLVRNFFHYPASFVAPIQRLEILHEWSTRIGAGRLGEIGVTALPYLLGSAWWTFIGWASLRQPERRASIGVGIILLTPPLFLPQPDGWIEVRHLYPAAAFLSPVAGSALVAAIRRRPVRGGVLASVWLAVILAGTVITQHRANQWSHSPGAMRRLEEVRSVRDSGMHSRLPATR